LAGIEQIVLIPLSPSLSSSGGEGEREMRRRTRKKLAESRHDPELPGLAKRSLS
jgi:hypothetical protein